MFKIQYVAKQCRVMKIFFSFRFESKHRFFRILQTFTNIVSHNFKILKILKYYWS